MAEALRILILEDNPIDAELVQFELQEAGIVFTAIVVMAEKDYVREIQEFCPDLIFSDYDLPSYNGALALAEARRRCPDTPFILVTGAVSEDRAIEILTQGAKDYVLKSRLQQRLVPAVQRALAEAEEHRARKQAENELRNAHRTLEERVKVRTAELEKEIERRIRIEETQQNYNERLRILSYAASRLLDSVNPQQLVEELCLKVMEFLDCQTFFNFLVDEAAGRLHLNAFAGIPVETAREIEWLDYGVAVCGCAARERCRIVAENIPATPDVRTELVKSFGIKAYACHPLMEKNQVLGTLSFGARSRTTFSVDDLAMMKSVADQVAIAMNRINMEKALRDSEGRYRELVQSSPDPVIVHRDGQFLYANPAALQMYGATSLEQLQTKTVLDLIHADEKAAIAGRMEQGKAGRKLPLWETRMIRLDGQVVPVESVGGLVNYDGKPAIQISFRDITDRKKADETLEKTRREVENEKRLLEAVIEAQVDAIILYDKQMNVKRVNPAFIHIYGFDPIGFHVTKIMQRVSCRLLDGKPLKLREQPTPRALHGEKVTGLRYIVTRADGSDGIVQVTSGPIRQQDHVVGAVTVWHDITELRKSEEALHASEEQFRNAFDNSAVAMALTSADGTFLKINPSFCHLVGYSGAELAGSTFLQLTHPDDLSANIEGLKSLASGKINKFRMEKRYLHKDGRVIWVDMSTSTMRNDKGNIDYFITQAQDITERKKAEEALHENEERLRLSLAAARMASWDWHVPSGDVVWNEMHYQMLGYKPGEVKPTHLAWSSRVHPDDIDKAQSKIQQCMSERQVYINEFRTLWPDGTIRHLEARGEFEYDTNNQPLRCYGVMLDVTERKQSEESLRESEEKFRSVLENSRDVIYRLNLQTGRYEYISPSAERVMGFSAAELMAEDVNTALTMLHPDDLPAVLAAHARLEETGEADVEYRQRTKKGDYRWLSNHLSLTKDSTGRPLYRSGNLSDITERRQAEEAMRESEERQRLLAETMMQGVVHQDASGEIIAMNPAAERILGKSREQFLGSSSVQEEHGTIRENGQLFPGTEHPSMVALRTGLPVRNVIMGVFNPKVNDYRWISIDAVPVFRSDKTRPSEVYTVFEDITENKLAEEKLRQSEDRYRALFDAMTEGFAIHEIITNEQDVPVDWRFLDINPAFERLTGLKREDVIGRTHNEVLPGDDPKWLLMYGAVALTGEPVQFENYSPALKRHYEVLAYRPAPRQFAVIFMDITERKQAEQRLFETNQRLQALMQAAPVGVSFSDDPTCQSITGNPAVLEQFEVSQEDNLSASASVADAPGRQVEFFLDGRRICDAELPLQRAVAENRVIPSMELEVRLPSGRVWFAEASGAPVRDAQGNIIGGIAVTADITKRKHAEIFLKEKTQQLENANKELEKISQELHDHQAELQLQNRHLHEIQIEATEARNKYTHLFDFAPIGYFTLDKKGHIVEVNVSGAALLGMEKRSLSRKPFNRFITPEHFSFFLSHLQEAIEHRDKQMCTLRMVKRDGRSFEALIETIAIFKDEGSFDHYRSSVTDISEMMRVETALKEQAQQLEAANRELESFSYSVSHDLRAPLRSIDGFSRRLLSKHSDELSEDATRMLSIIRSNTERMGVLIDDLLSFSRILNSSMVISEINMDNLVHEVWDEVKAAYEEREIEFRSTEMLPVFGDRALIRQVLFNLFSNAVKFTRIRKPGIIGLSSYRENARVVYCIKDNGAGFDMTYYDKLFGVFQRLHSLEEYEGTGVGLALVHRIIQRHGGHVWAEGEVDKGAAFYFALPEKEKD